LTGPAFSWLLHGPANPAETAPVVHDLAPFHSFASDPPRGGTIVGSLQYSEAQAADLVAGLHYINVYTPGNLGGEIRGQLTLVPEPRPVALLIVAALGGLGTLAVRRRASVQQSADTKL
jgi:hypothetical protein